MPSERIAETHITSAPELDCRAVFAAAPTPPDKLQSVFEPFVQVESGLKRGIHARASAELAA